MPDILFHEEQSFRIARSRLLVAIPPAAVTLLAVWQVVLGHKWGRYPTSNGGLIFLAILLWLVYRYLARVRLVTTVEPGAVTVQLTGLWRQDRIEASQITAAAAGAFDLREVGGYGWRTYKGGRSYLAGDTPAVRLQMRGGSTIVLGTERPVELAKAIEIARRSPQTAKPQQNAKK